MTDEQRPDIQLGTGSPRSELDADVTQPDAGPPTDGPPSSAALPDDIEPNRSGSGGSGGPMGEDADPSEEGSTGQSMDELLGGDEVERGAR
jgi:hypothetical protein